MLLDSWILENFMNHIASFLRNLVDHIALSESGPIILDSWAATKDRSQAISRTFHQLSPGDHGTIMHLVWYGGL